MSGDSPLVSVVIPVGGVDEHLPGQLDALVTQDYSEDWELVLSLNSDEPAERRDLEALLAARPELRARVVDSAGLRSASYARNVGADAARGERLLFCDGDDLVDPGWISALVDALGAAPAVGGYLEEHQLAIAGQEHWRPPATPDGLPTFLGKPFVVTANMAITRPAFDKAGGFDTSLIRGEDIALSWELLDQGLELGYAADAVVHYRHREGWVPMLRQHYLYGRGLSQVITNRGVPGGGGAHGLRALKPNAQPVDHKGLAYIARRASIAIGRLVGLVEGRMNTRWQLRGSTNQ
ncbi:MAG: glycosyltransferase [Actinomycetia bacterium]|nr:glycosyltransferase [Actinomycetes bacterium]